MTQQHNSLLYPLPNPVHVNLITWTSVSFLSNVRKESTSKRMGLLMCCCQPSESHCVYCGVPRSHYSSAQHAERRSCRRDGVDVVVVSNYHSFVSWLLVFFTLLPRWKEVGDCRSFSIILGLGSWASCYVGLPSAALSEEDALTRCPSARPSTWLLLVCMCVWWLWKVLHLMKICMIQIVIQLAASCRSSARSSLFQFNTKACLHTVYHMYIYVHSIF